MALNPFIVRPEQADIRQRHARDCEALQAESERPAVITREAEVCQHAFPRHAGTEHFNPLTVNFGFHFKAWVCIWKIMIVESELYVMAKNALGYFRKHAFKIIGRERLFVIRRKIKSTYLVKHVHMFPVNLIFPIHFGIANHAKRFCIFNFLFCTRVVQVVIPHDRVVSAQDMAIVDIVCVGFAPSGMPRWHIEKIEYHVNGNNFRYFNHIKAF